MSDDTWYGKNSPPIGAQVTRPEEECTPVYPPSQTRTGKPPKIRVLRVLEYIYDNAEIAAQDMAGWTQSISRGSVSHPQARGRQGMTMISATFPFDTIEWDETPS